MLQLQVDFLLVIYDMKLYVSLINRNQANYNPYGFKKHKIRYHCLFTKGLVPLLITWQEDQ